MDAVGLLYDHARAALPLFARLLEGVVAPHAAAAAAATADEHSISPVRLSIGPLKGVYRTCEKMCLKGGFGRYHANDILDMVRARIVCDSCQLMESVVSAIAGDDRVQHSCALLTRDHATAAS